MTLKPLTPQHLQWLLMSWGAMLLTHVMNLPIWIIIVSLGFGIWRYLLNRKHWALPRMLLLIPITIVVCVAVLINFGSHFGRDASISLLVLMSAMKLLETKTIRDYLLIIAIAFFLVASTFVFNQNVSTFLISLAPLILLTAALVQTSLPQTASIPYALTLAGKMLLQSIPLMLVLFLLFPRLPGPIWGISKDASNGMTGLDDTLELGDVSNLTKNSSIAFRVQFKNDIPPPSQLYWRGPVLWHQQNNRWLTNKNKQPLKQEALTFSGEPVEYTITLEPHNRLWLLMLDMPTTMPSIATLKHDYSAIAKSPVRSRIRYQVTSHLQYTVSKTLETKAREVALTINKATNPQSQTLVNGWKHLAPAQIINKALTHFSQQPFFYTLKPPRLGKHAVDDFLFKTQKGFCEHYASSFVYLMRAAGVPARIVTGYQGGELNTNGNYLIVRQSDAHAWAEVWLENKGWVRIDPTAAVSPERIEKGIDATVLEADELPMFVGQINPWVKEAYLNWDNINNHWNQWVLGYDNQKQLDFLNKLSGKKLNMTDIAIAMISMLLLTMLITAGFVLKRGRLTRTPTQQLYTQHMKQLKKMGVETHADEGALSLARRAGQQYPAQADALLAIATLYNELTYSAQQNKDHKLHLLKIHLQDIQTKQHVR